MHDRTWRYLLPRIPSNAPNRPAESPRELGGIEGTVLTNESVGDQFEARNPGAVFEAYFTPEDPAAKAELRLIDSVIAGVRADERVYPPGENPHKIHYAVYNLRSQKVIDRLIEAHKLGVDVRVLIEADQISPERDWNTVDEQFEAAGLNVLRSDRDASLESREASHLLGIDSNHLMHLKSRIYRTVDPSSGEPVETVLSGSMNPGDGASRNDENLNMIRDPRLVSLYEKKFEDVRRHERTDNVWAAERGMNVLFTPAKSGPRPIEKLFEWIDAENEFIALSVFDLKDLKSPTDQKKLTEKLIEAKARGVEVLVITDRKKSDGRDLDGNRIMMYGHYASNSWLDEDLERAGIPVHEFINPAGPYNAVHAKAAVFGLTDMKVMTGAGNWTRAGIGSGRKRAKNEESFLFIESSRVDNGRTGRRYLANMLGLLRKYDGQDADHGPAKATIEKLQSLANWPKVQVMPEALLGGREGDYYLVSDHPALQPQNDAPGYLIKSESAGISLPFGSLLEYEIQDANGQVVESDRKLVVRPPEDETVMPEAP